MTDPQQSGRPQGVDDYNSQYNSPIPWTGGDGGRYTSPEEAAQQQLIAQGYDPNSTGFFDLVQNMVARAQGQAAANQQRAQQTQTLSQDVEFRSGFSASNTDYQGYDHAALKSMVESVSPEQVTGVSDSWTKLANAMATFGQQLSQASTKSGATWKGDAAESAYNFTTGLGTWSDQTGQAAQLAANQTYSQSSAAETAKNSMPEPIPFSWSDEIKSWGGGNPLDIVDNIGKSFEKQQESQDAHDQASQVMSTYDTNLYDAASKAPAFNPPPTFSGPGTGEIGSVPGKIGGTEASGYTGGTGGIGGGPAGGLSGSTGASSAGSVSGALDGAGGTGSLAAGAKTGSLSSAAGNTRAQGFQSSKSFTPSTGGSSSGDLSGMGGMPMAPMMGGMGGAGGDEYQSKVGRGGGGSFGPGGGSGSAASSGSATGAGAQSGAKLGGAGAAETVAGGRGAAGAGARGGSGMGGMGHGGKKGEGGEDDEHQRPSWLVEADPDSIFGTDERTAPPVIGE